MERGNLDAQVHLGKMFCEAETDAGMIERRAKDPLRPPGARRAKRRFYSVLGNITPRSPDFRAGRGRMSVISRQPISHGRKQMHLKDYHFFVVVEKANTIS